LTNAASNVFLTNKLFEILNLFKENDILALPFKGPVLAESVYGDISLRKFVDLDILVHKRIGYGVKSFLLTNGLLLAMLPEARRQDLWNLACPDATRQGLLETLE